MMTKRQKTPEGRFCGCGKPATKYDGDGWTCDRCLRLTTEANERLDKLIFDRKRAELPEEVWNARRERWLTYGRIYRANKQRAMA